MISQCWTKLQCKDRTRFASKQSVYIHKYESVEFLVIK